MSDSAAHVVFDTNYNCETLNIHSLKFHSHAIPYSPTWSPDSGSDIGCLSETWSLSRNMPHFSGIVSKICWHLKKWFSIKRKSSPPPTPISSENHWSYAISVWSAPCEECLENASALAHLPNTADEWDERSEMYNYPEEFINVYFDNEHHA